MNEQYRHSLLGFRIAAWKLPAWMLLAWMLLAWMLLAPAAFAQSEEPTFEGEERVTAVDLVVGFERDGLKKWSTGRGAPKKLDSRDFEVLFDGEPRPVVAAESGDGEPWTLLVWFDQKMTGTYELSWAADLLTRYTDELTRLGHVEVVVADPVPRTELAATRDAGELKRVLSQLALRLSPTRAAPRQVELLAMRGEFLAEALHPTPAVDTEEFARWATREEVRIGQGWQDHLLDFLIERAGASPRRALFLVSSGFDVRPGVFYLPAVGLDAEAYEPTTANLVAPTQELARTLAAYGWVVAPVIPPPPDPELRRGPRVGKFRIQPFGAVRESERDPGKAEAYLELGAALARQGKLEDAEDALKRAVHHFYGNPRTGKRQARALIELGRVQEALGKAELAERSFAEARVYDPVLATELLGPEIALLEPEAPLDFLAETTTGAPVRRDKDLEKALQNLADRVRLTYQVPGLATGDLRSVSAVYRGERELHAPGWARSGTPETVAAARVRQLLSGEVRRGELEVKALLAPSLEFPDESGIRTGAVTVTLDGAAWAEGTEALLRVSVATGAPDVLARVEHETPRIVEAGRESEWSSRHELRLRADESIVTVFVEDLYTGRRGSAVVTLADPDREADEYP